AFFSVSSLFSRFAVPRAFFRTRRVGGHGPLSRPAEHGLDGLAFLVGDQVPVPLPHLLRLVTDPGVDESLVGPGRRTVRAKAMAKNVPAVEHLPFAPGQDAVEVVVGLVPRHRGGGGSFRLAANDSRGLTEQELPARM